MWILIFNSRKREKLARAKSDRWLISLTPFFAKEIFEQLMQYAQVHCHATTAIHESLV
jgi:hypothetical protein